jgi:hypothetical protein
MAQPSPATNDRTTTGARPTLGVSNRSDARLKVVLTAVARAFWERPWLAGTILVIVVWTVRLLALHYTASGYVDYGSDDAAQQNLLADWQRGFRQGTIVGPDDYFLKYPLYLLINNLPIGPLKQLFIASWALLATTAILTLKAAELCCSPIATRLRVPNRLPLAILVVAVALAATPVLNFYWLQFPNSRNLEIGLGLYLLARLHLYLNGEAEGRSPWLNCLDIALAAALFADDPLTLYVLAPPVVVVIALCGLRSPATGKALPLRRLGMAIGSLVVASGLALVLTHALEVVLPLHISAASTQTVAATTFFSNLQYFVTDAIQMFGLTPWSVGLHTSATLLTVVYAGLSAATILGFIWAWRREPGQVLVPFLVAIFVWLLVLFLGADVGTGGNDRELQFCAAILTFGLGITVVYAANVRLVAAVATVATCALVVVLSTSAWAFLHQRATPDQPQLATVATLESLHLKKGYADYWDAGIDRFLSREHLDIVNVECSDASTPSYFNWYSDKGMLNVHADRTFYILSDTDTSVCPLATLVRFLGPPSRVVPVPTTYDPTEILIYDYDIGPRLLTGKS